MAYKAHQHCDTPTEDTVVWRYMGFPRLMSLLETGKVWLSRADLLDDPREACLTEPEQNQIREHHGEKAEGFIRSLEHERHATFLNCWHESNNESMAMWDLYGKESASVAVKSTIGRLKQSLGNEQRAIHITRVKYFDWTTGASWPNNVLGMAVRKAEGFKHESEVRLVTWAYDVWQFDFGREGPPLVFHAKEIEDCIVALFKEQSIFTATLEEDMRKAVPRALNRWMAEFQLSQIPKGITVKVDTVQLIQEVIVGPREPEWVFDLLQEIVKRYRLVAVVKWSALRYSPAIG
jgi:hypothetical protein